jgi:hypothetical protein
VLSGDVHGPYPRLLDQVYRILSHLAEILEIADTEVLPHFFLFTDQKLASHQPGFKGLEKLKSFVDEAMR